MLRPRVIPTLLIQNKGLVKTCRFKNPVYLGDPINAIKIFNEKEVDELVIFDIEASKNGKGIDWNMLNRINREAFMPLGYGGGINNIQDIKRIINLGYEKVIINSAALDNPQLIKDAAEIIGSQSLVICVDIRKNLNGSFKVYNHINHEITNLDPVEYIKTLESIGAGEIIVQSVDKEGTYLGYDINITKEISRKVKIPVIALGGASSLMDINQVLKSEISAAAAGSIFVFFGRLRAVLINYPSHEEIEKQILQIVIKPTLIIFTEGNTDAGFIAPELNVIYDNFDRINIYPIRWDNKPSLFKFTSNISFRSDMADYVKSISSGQKKLLGVCSPLFWSSILKIKPSKYKSLLNTCGYVTALCKWINELDFNRDNTIFYSYWLTASALALTSLKEQKKIIYLVSRAHGFDLYNERGDYILNFFKPYIFGKINKLYCISEYGKHYLAKKYKNYSDKFFVSRLGTFNQFKFTTVISDTFEIVSCSFLAPVKRIELLILGMEDFQNKFPSIQIKWIHIGGGTLFDSTIGFARQKLKPGTFNFKGTLSISDIYNLYSNNSFGCLINVSESEGLPVSIMEAQSFGIPVIATAVGGTPEIVNDENGLLLSVNPTPHEIATAIYDVFINKEKWQKKRVLSRKNWEENFDAEKNYKAFAAELLSLINSG
jgi:imidazole glycerol-phosphate synthase subunit HisF